MQDIFEECIYIINAYEFQIQEAYKEEIEEIKKTLGKEAINIKPYALDKKIECAKRLFIELNLLLKRNDYLKGSVYGEDENLEDEEVEEVDNKHG